MGNEESHPVVDDSVPPNTLTARTLDALAAYLTRDPPPLTVVMTGAGISTSAGIPDFRSPDTGLYANLARLNLPFAEAVFDISYFRSNPEPFYTLAAELYPGKHRPTITHSFLRLLHDKGILLRHFTQNIDCLDAAAGVPPDRTVAAHGSFATQRCIDCAAPYPDAALHAHLAARTIPRCEDCAGLVKPDIVFFGEALPPAFFAARGVPAQAELCVVLGTSLTVQPFASLPGLVREATPRVLINKERVGDFGTRADDVLVLGDCDDGVRRLAKACGWLEELEALWAETAPAGDKAQADAGKEGAVEAKSKDEKLEDEIDQLTKEVDETLVLSKWHEEKVRKEHASEKSQKADATSKPASPPSAGLAHVFVGHKQQSATAANTTTEESGQSDKTDKNAPSDGSKL